MHGNSVLTSYLGLLSVAFVACLIPGLVSGPGDEVKSCHVSRASNQRWDEEAWLLDHMTVMWCAVFDCIRPWTKKISTWNVNGIRAWLKVMYKMALSRSKFLRAKSMTSPLFFRMEVWSTSNVKTRTSSAFRRQSAKRQTFQWYVLPLPHLADSLQLQTCTTLLPPSPLG